MGRRMLSSLAMALALGLLAATPAGGEAPPAGEGIDLSVVFLRVGKADAAVIRLGDGRAWMVDAGHKSSAPLLVGALRTLGIRRLEGVFISHGHGDHVGGLEAVAAVAQIGALYAAGLPLAMHDAEGRIDELARKLSLPVVDLYAGDRIPLAPGVEAEVLGPVRFNAVRENDNSLVLRLRAGERSFLFTGDMQFDEETDLMRSGVPLRADVLKVGNHGNPDATGAAFAAAVAPGVAVISTDTRVDTDSANPRVLKALGGARVLLTQDTDLGVTVWTDGRELRTETPARPAPAPGLSILRAELARQRVTLGNGGARADLHGYMLFSEKGSEFLIFPPGTVVESGAELSVASRGHPGDYIWPEKNVWSKKGGDVAVLYDPWGNELDRAELR